MWWSFLLAGFSLAGIWIAGKRPRLGWLWCMAMEIPWTIWAISLKQYGFALLCSIYFFVYLRNSLNANKANRKENNEHQG